MDHISTNISGQCPHGIQIHLNNFIPVGVRELSRWRSDMHIGYVISRRKTHLLCIPPQFTKISIGRPRPPSFFEAVYLVDLSPSLCKIATERFERLGWKNVKVMCCDARYFRLETFAKQSDISSLPVQTASTSRSSSRPVTIRPLA